MKEQYIKYLLDIIPPKSRVLDLGCGNGQLLDLLIKHKEIKGYGIEIDDKKIIECVQQGISVFHGNIDEGLAEFLDHSFDYVILSETLQEVQKPLFVLGEILRVGRKAIVLFPNFAHWKVRLQLILGRMPKTNLLPFDWFNTPNIRLVTINDFKELCEKLEIKISKEINPVICSNFFSEEGFFVLEK